MLKPVVEPVTWIRWPLREPVITIDGFDCARGTTAFDGADDSDQPAPVSAFTVKVYAVPLESPVTWHVSADVMHTRLPGEDVTAYVDTGYDPVDSGADQDTAADASPATADTDCGADAGTAGGAGGDEPPPPPPPPPE